MKIGSHPQQVRATVPSVASFPVLLTETLGYHCAANQDQGPAPRDFAFVQNQVHAPGTPAPLGSELLSLFRHAGILDRILDLWQTRECFKILFKCLC